MVAVEITSIAMGTAVFALDSWLCDGQHWRSNRNCPYGISGSCRTAKGGGCRCHIINYNFWLVGRGYYIGLSPIYMLRALPAHTGSASIMQRRGCTKAKATPLVEDRRLNPVITPLKVQEWEALLQVHPNRQFVSFISEDITNGFLIWLWLVL